jgi:hypothetical protein
MILLPALLLLAWPPVETAVVRGPGRGGWLELDAGLAAPVSIVVADSTRIAWHRDPSVRLAAADLHPGTRIRLVCPFSVAERIEVLGLGPLAMGAAVEEWVAGTRGARAWRALPAGDLAELDRLGAPCWRVREAATRALRGRGGGAIPALTWGRRHADPEVRARAEGLLRELGGP